MSRVSHARSPFASVAASQPSHSGRPGPADPFRAWSAVSRIACQGALDWLALFDPAADLRPGYPGGSWSRASLPGVHSGVHGEQRTFACPQGARAYRLFVPARLPDGPSGLVLMLHGCKQDADGFARGTRMNDLAEDHGLIVAWPNQTRLQNPLGCWQWFEPHHQRHGEPAILAGLARSLATEFCVPAQRIFAAGLSAGGAMAAVLGATYRDLFSAIGVHSGLPCRAAASAAQARAAMRGEFHVATPGMDGVTTVPTIVFQGDADSKVPAHPCRHRLQRPPRGCDRKNRIISADASGPLSSVKGAEASPPDQAWPAPSIIHSSARQVPSRAT